MEFVNIYENNLKNINFKADINEFIIIKGVSGSGKSTLAERVIYAESFRQEQINKGSNNIYYYTVRPNFEHCYHVLPALFLAQAPSKKSKSSTVATKTAILNTIKDIFVEEGLIINNGKTIEEQDSLTTLQLLEQYYPKAETFYLFSDYQDFSYSRLESFYHEFCDGEIIVIDEKDKYKQITLKQAKRINSEKYQLLLKVSSKHLKQEKDTRHLVLRFEMKWYFFNRYLLDPYSGDLLLKKQISLFTKTTNSSLANYCRTCLGEGEVNNIECAFCGGSGFGEETLKVFVQDKNIFDILSLSVNELFKFFSHYSAKTRLILDLLESLSLLQTLSLGHLQLNRTSASLSSGENQRLKIFNLLKKKIKNKVIILDEPTVNLSFYDIDKIAQLLKKLNKDNILIAIEHNDFFDKDASRIIYLGEKSGIEGGYITPKPKVENIKKYPPHTTHTMEVTLPILYNVAIEHLAIPNNQLISVIGSSGSGKTTLVLKLLPEAIKKQGYQVQIFANETIHNNSRSIVASYLGVFDKIRKIFFENSKESIEQNFNISDFSFNSSGACKECQGDGYIVYNNKIHHKQEMYICPQCQGNRYRNDVALFKINNMSIIDILNLPLSAVSNYEIFNFLKETECILYALSLEHLNLGRAINSLSGGERQRLRFANFLINNERALSEGGTVFLFDEITSGLDKNSINKILKLFYKYMNSNTIICIEHNPYFVEMSNMVINLGEGLHIKTTDNISIVNDFKYQKR